jgi:hypothetical protein
MCEVPVHIERDGLTQLGRSDLELLDFRIVHCRLPDLFKIENNSGTQPKRMSIVAAVVSS